MTGHALLNAPGPRLGSRAGGLRASRAVPAAFARGTIAAPRQRTFRIDAVATDASLRDFVGWLERAKAIDPAKAASMPVLTPDGPKLQTTRAVKEGEVLFSVPTSAFLSAAVVDASPMGKYVEGAKGWIKIALFLISERANPSSEWGPFLALLPDEPDGTMFWTDEQLSLLGGSQLLASTLNYREYVAAEYTFLKDNLFTPNARDFPEDVFTAEALAWAFGILRSRCHEPLNDGDDLALVPLADLTTHNVSCNARTEMGKAVLGGLVGKEGLILKADREYGAGEAVTMNYGIFKSDSAVALDYGALGGTDGGAFYLTLAIPEGDRFYDDKADIAEQAGLAESFEFSFAASEDPPKDMTTFLRLMNMGGTDSFLLEALFRTQSWELISEPVSEENERNVASSMVTGCAEALEGYATSIEEDLQMLSDGVYLPGSREFLAVRARLGEKQALKSCKRYFDKVLANLEETEFYQERRLKGLGLLDDNGATTYDSLMSGMW